MFGRHVNHDPRSRGFAYRATKAGGYGTVLHERHVPIFGQGDTQACTGYAAIGCMATGRLWDTTLARVPFYPLDPSGALAAYSAATYLDPFPGSYPEQDTGSDGNSIAKALRNAEMIRGWRHAFSLDGALAALQHQPVIFGCNWYESMMTPDDSGALSVHGKIIGGHEVVVGGYDALMGRVRIDNSWGPEWGAGGSAWLRFTDLKRLMHEDGDITIFTPVP